MFCVFFSGVQKEIVFQKPLWSALMPGYSHPRFSVTASPLSSLQNATPYQNIPLWRLHVTEDLQQKSIWCLSGCFSPMNTSKLVAGKLSDSWVTGSHLEPTHRWQKLGQELRNWGPREITQTAGRAVCVGNAGLKGSSSRYWQFPGKGIKYQKHETRKKGLRKARTTAPSGVGSSSRSPGSIERAGKTGEWAFTSHRWMKGWSVTRKVVIHHSQRDSFSRQTVNHFRFSPTG